MAYRMTSARYTPTAIAARSMSFKNVIPSSIASALNIRNRPAARAYPTVIHMIVIHVLRLE